MSQVNKPEAASSLLEKAGKMIEKERPGDATGLFEKAAETVRISAMLEKYNMSVVQVSTEDRPNVAAEFVGRAGRLQVSASWC